MAAPLAFPERRRRPTRLSSAQRVEAQIFALQIIRDPAYRARLLADARARALDPRIETLLWHYGIGVPTTHIELGRPGDFDDLADLTNEELAARASAAVVALLSPVSGPPSSEEQALAEHEVDAALQERSEQAARMLSETQAVDARRDELSEARGKRQAARLEALKAQLRTAPDKLRPKQIGELLELGELPELEEGP